jgi:ABC-type nitrate/sulfonate/bicarbonate transport system substrate-binding protein
MVKLRRLFLFSPVVLLALSASTQAQQLKKITISYPTRSGATWPMYIAKEAGIYKKYGYDVTLSFGVHPTGIAAIVSGDAAMANYSLEQAMQASIHDPNFVLAGTSLNKGLFALIAAKNFTDVKQLKGKRIAVGQVGDAPYNYTVALLGTYGLGVRDVVYIPVGTDVSGRAAALQSGRADATLLTAPNYFRLEEMGYKNLASLADHSDIYASTVYLFRKNTIAADPGLPEALIKSHAEAIKRFYDDKPTAVKAYIVYDKQPDADVARIYDVYKKGDLFERIPYVLAGAIKSIQAQQVDPTIGPQIKAFDFKKVVDNSYIDKLVKAGFFEQLYGPGVKAEEQKKAKLAYGK